MDIQNHVFLISGGGSGLGAAAAARLVAGGARVVLADINPAAAETAAALGDAARFVLTDVTDEQSVRAAIAVATTELGGLHGVVASAGVGTAEKLLGSRGVHRLESFQRTLQINLTGTFNVARLAAEVMAHNPPTADGERGVLIFTASIAAFDGQIGQAAYSASKAGIVGMTLPLARELAGVGIRVMAIAPGPFDTPLLRTLPEPARNAVAQQVPFPKRLGDPAEFGALVAHIVENAMLNGAVIRLDGALRMA